MSIINHNPIILYTEKQNTIVSVRLSTHIFAQGQFIRHLDDGRIMIDCNGSRYTGYWIKRQKYEA